MNRLLLVLLVLLVFGIVPAIAQQLPLFTQYRSYQGILNPASLDGDYFTFENNVSFGLSYRKQWTTLDAAPTTQALSGSYFQDIRGFSLLAGGYLLNDQTGPTGFTGAYGRVGGVLSDNPEFGGLAFGLNAGLVQYRVNSSELRLREQGDVIGMEDQSQWFPDVGLGVYAYTMLDGGFFDNDYVFGGISVPQLFGLDLSFETAEGTFYTKRVQHIYANAGWYHFFRNEGFLEVTAWAKYAPAAPVNADFNIRYQMQSNFWVGTGLSTAGNMHLEAGFLLGDNVGFDNTLRIGYGFDYSISTFGPYVGPTHEINLNYSFSTY